MPGCVEFGVRVFSECCALESVGNIVDGGSHLAIGAIISQYAFEECAKLAQILGGRQSWYSSRGREVNWRWTTSWRVGVHC